MRASPALAILLLTGALSGCVTNERTLALTEPSGVAAARLSERIESHLEGPSESLHFLVSELDRDLSTSRVADSIPLADGRILAFVDGNPLRYEVDALFLELRSSSQGLLPSRIGLQHLTCTRFPWREGMSGRVVVDSSNPDLLDCHVELAGFSLDFRIEPAMDSARLREFVSAGG